MSLDRTGSAPFGTLIVPVYNAAPFLEASLRDIHSWLGARDEPWELILVDDASNDASCRILAAFADAHRGERIRVLRFETNRGKGFAVRVGLERAEGNVAVFTDCDLAYPVANIDRIVERLERGADAAIANRVAAQSTYMIHPGFFPYLFTRHVFGRVFNAICRVVAMPRLCDTQAGLKGFKTAAVRPLVPRLRLDGFSFDVELLRGLADRGARIDEVPVDYRYDSEPSTLEFAWDAARMLRDLVRVRWNSFRGLYTEDSPSRRVIIHADDYGLAPGINRAVEEGLSSGALHSASILLGGEHASAALAWAAAHPEFDFGVHLNLTQGRPVGDAASVPSLVDGDGRFHRLAPLLLRLATGRLNLSEVAAEWRAQIATVRQAGVRISHLDSHQHVHLVPSVFRGVAAGLALDERLTLRAMDGPRSALPAVKGILLAIATRVSVGRRFRHLVAAHGAGAASRGCATLDDLRSFLAGARPGETVELVVHPGFPDDALRASGDTYQEGRERERALLFSEDARSWIRMSGFSPSNFRADGRTLK